MKKVSLCTILAICLILLAGCKKEEIVMTVEDVQANTVLVKNDGIVQAATVEEFNKDYYNLTELNDFITNEIKDYNNKAGLEAISLNDLKAVDGNAILILNYATIEHYTLFNQVEATFATMEAASNGEISLPDVFIKASDGAFVSKELALENMKYKVLIINENTDVIVDGSIKFYTNGVLVTESIIQAAADEETVIIYKP